MSLIAPSLWRGRPRKLDTPRWPESGIVALAGGGFPGHAGHIATPTPRRERWIVAVNPDCSHCRDRLAALDAMLATRLNAPALGVLLVDVARRPDSLAGTAHFAAGVWWDSAGVWRSRWGQRSYGQVLVFDDDGRLRRILPPDSSAAGEGR